MWYDRYIEKFIPKYATVSIIFCFVFNSLIYSGTQFLMRDVMHYDLTSGFDRSVPFVSQWIYIYLVCFLFWAVNYIMISQGGKEQWFKFAVGDYLSRIICGIIFIIVPTTNIRPEVTGKGLSEILTRFVYSVDPATNLFPSIHCLVSWMCFVGIRKRKDVPIWYKIFSCVFALLVCASTQFTKQHYIIDVFAGIVIAEAAYFIGNHTGIYRVVTKFFEKINNSIFREDLMEEYEEEIF